MENTSNITTRDYRPADAATLIALFREAVSVTAATAYEPAQIAAWLSAIDDPVAFTAAREEGWIRIAENAEGPVGFAQINLPGYLDMLYVAPRAARQGAASALLEDMLELAGAMAARDITTNASRVARAFFLKHGFTEVETENVECQGVKIERFKMKKKLA